MVIRARVTLLLRRFAVRAIEFSCAVDGPTIDTCENDGIELASCTRGARISPPGTTSPFTEEPRRPRGRSPPTDPEQKTKKETKRKEEKNVRKRRARIRSRHLYRDV